MSRYWSDLPLALGIIQGCLRLKGMESFDKDGLVSNLEKVEEILLDVLYNPASNNHQIKEVFIGKDAEELKEGEESYLSNKLLKAEDCK